MKVDQTIPRYTYKDYAQWGGDWELINGYPYAMSPSAKMKHQFLGNNLVVELNQALSKYKTCRCRVVYELDWIINEATVVRPDIMVICGSGSILDDFLRYPPSLIVEILSENTRLKDRTTKFELYQQQGVQYYVIADPDKESLEIFELVNNAYMSNDALESFLFHEECKVQMSLKSVFSNIR